MCACCNPWVHAAILASSDIRPVDFGVMATSAVSKALAWRSILLTKLNTDDLEGIADRAWCVHSPSILLVQINVI